MKKNIIYLCICICYSSDFLPENNALINYTQVFFQWPQIENANNYQLTIFSDLNEPIISNCLSNSLINDELLNWNTNYIWEVCGLDSLNLIIDCHQQKVFSINSLPAYYPSQIEVISLSDEYYYEGFTIVDFDSEGFSVALDKYGFPIWFVDKYLFGTFNPKILVTQLLKSGNYIGIGVGSGYEFDINGNILFETPSEYGTHHHFIKEDNTYFLIDAIDELHPCPEDCPENLPENIYWQGDKFIQLDSNGDLIWEWNTFDYINLSEFNPLYLQRLSNSYPEETSMDWTHSNSIFYNIDNQKLFVSVRNLSRIIKIDYDSKDIIWEFGDIEFMDEIYFDNEIEFSQQHSVKEIENNNILFFDNHTFLDPELSRCIEFTYNEFSNDVEMIWEYVLPDSMFTGSRGECDRLNNGNTLINAGRSGNIIEINNNNEIVWHLRMKAHNNLEIASFRASRIDNLYPLAFSIIINNLKGSYINQDYYLENTSLLEFELFNKGWAEQTYQFSILNSQSDEIYSNTIIISANTMELTQVDISQINFNFDEDYVLEVFPTIKPDLSQEIYFSFVNNIAGDINNDFMVNIIDIVELINLILDTEYNENGDLNNDGTLNILDVISLVNIILNIL